jgi:fatty acid amide hydrolase 2
LSELLHKSAIELAKELKKGTISSLELIQVHIEHIQKVNPSLNAIVQDRFSLAIEEAKKADELLRKKSNLPLYHGVPCTIKECFALTGMPQSSGLLDRKNKISDTDAITVQRLRKAGFIPLGVSNLSELCMWMESNNKVYGRTSNPYDVSRTVGGSSGGEGAIIGAGGSPVGLGSDIGGSIRMPAFFNGIFGHKPSAGLIPNHGQYPLAENEALNYLCTGPMCRRAEDLPYLTKILAGENAHRILDDDIDISSLKVLSIFDDGRISVSNELHNVQQAVVDYLEKKGAKIQTIKVDGLYRSVEIWSAMLENAGGKTFRELLFCEEPRSLHKELIRYFLGIGQYTFPALGLVLLEKLSKVGKGQVQQFVQQGEQLQQEFRQLLDGNTILLYPSHPVVAPKHGHALIKPWRFAYTAIINVMKLPATQVPISLNSEGLPMGIQVIANEGKDHKCFAVAQLLEKQFGGWKMPKQWSID